MAHSQVCTLRGSLGSCFRAGTPSGAAARNTAAPAPTTPAQFPLLPFLQLVNLPPPSGLGVSTTEGLPCFLPPLLSMKHLGPHYSPVRGQSFRSCTIMGQSQLQHCLKTPSTHRATSPLWEFHAGACHTLCGLHHTCLNFWSSPTFVCLQTWWVSLLTGKALCLN